MGINESNQETCDTMNNSEMSEVLRNNPQNKTRYLCCLSPSLHCTLWMYSNVFFSGEAVSFRYWFFMFHFVLFRERPPFICHDPVFYGKIVLRPISYVAKMLMAKLPRTGRWVEWLQGNVQEWGLGVLRKVTGVLYKGHDHWLSHLLAITSLPPLFLCHCLVHHHLLQSGDEVSVHIQGGTRGHGINVPQLALTKKWLKPQNHIKLNPWTGEPWTGT